MNVDPIVLQGVRWPTASVCHLASFVPEWLRLGVEDGVRIGFACRKRRVGVAPPASLRRGVHSEQPPREGSEPGKHGSGLVELGLRPTTTAAKRMKGGWLEDFGEGGERFAVLGGEIGVGDASADDV